jgi:hypothetical protein
LKSFVIDVFKLEIIGSIIANTLLANGRLSAPESGLDGLLNCQFSKYPSYTATPVPDVATYSCHIIESNTGTGRGIFWGHGAYLNG